jgi:hypothetical protein
MVRRFTVAAMVSAALIAAGGCTSSPQDAPSAGRAAASSGPAQASAASAPRPVLPHVRVTSVRTADGAVVTVAVFYGAVRYALHNGSMDPGKLAARLVHDGPAVRGAERGQLLAAFNGGFKLKANVGGYEQEGHVIKPLRRGMASLVIDRSGAARIAVWGDGAPGPGEQVYSVRQNLPPLILDGHPVPAAAHWSAWGGTVGSVAKVARSALGQDRAGDLIYAGSMSATPADLAGVLARAGAKIAMELDINPNWVQLDVASRPGGSLRARVPGQLHGASQYLAGWGRDFIAVLG